jgi:hypothetical protein
VTFTAELQLSMEAASCVSAKKRFRQVGSIQTVAIDYDIRIRDILLMKSSSEMNVNQGQKRCKFGLKPNRKYYEWNVETYGPLGRLPVWVRNKACL